MIIVMKNIANWFIGFCVYLFSTIFYQKFFGEEPFNNSFSIGFPRFYYEFYSSDCVKLNGNNFINLLLNIVIYILIFLVYIKILRKEKK
jgi:hypothetical protein